MGRTNCPDYWERGLALGSIYELRQCPYEFSHWVKSIKFHSHIVRCRANFPERAKNMQICSYNQSHHMPKGKEVMEEHLKTCYEYHVWLHEHYAEGRRYLEDEPTVTTEPKLVSSKDTTHV